MRPFSLSVLALALVPTLLLAQAPKPKKIVLIAGKKSHGPGHHEYEKGLRLVKFCLDSAENLTGLKTELHLDGWPADPKTLDDADTIVVFCDGSDRDVKAHPLLEGDRLAVLAKQMKRGCGFVALHYTVFVPVERGGAQFLDWLGGHFDYETGTAANRWASKITTAKTTPRPMRKDHPICRGLEPFELREEYYHHIRFRPGDGRLAPILATAIPNEEKEQLVAWAVERADGGRGFGFTGGHFHDNWAIDGYRRMILNAVVWSAKAEVPEGGVKSKLPTDAQLQEVPVGKPAGAANPKKEPPPATIALTAGRFGRALNATASPLQIDGQERFRQTPITVECWAKLADGKGFNVLVACDPKTSKDHWELYSYAGSGCLAVYLPGMQPSEIVSTANVCDNKWHHVAFTSDGKTVKLYVDGKVVKEQAIQPRAGLKAVPGPLTIGMALDGNGSRVGCDGLIDEVRLSSVLREFTAVPEKAPDLDMPTIGLWHFDAPDEIGDPAWTPRPVAGDVPWWWKETDKDWVDGRLRETDTGPTFAGTFRYPTPGGPAFAYKGLAVRLGAKRDAGMLFDRAQLRWSAGWTGGYLQHADRRFGLLNTPAPAATPNWVTTTGPGWRGPDGVWRAGGEPTAPLPRDAGRFDGHYLHGERVVVAYTVNGIPVRECAAVEDRGGQHFFTRTMEVGPSDKEQQALVCNLPPVTGTGTQQAKKLASFWVLDHADGRTVAGVAGPGSLFRQGDQLILSLPPAKEPRRLKVLLARLPSAVALDQKLLDALDATPAADDLATFTKGGPARWKPLATKGEKAADDAPYVIDTLTLPYDNPYKALLFLGGVDFLGPKTTAVSAAHGDVWTVTDEKGDLSSLTWRRHATGLYHPLGLKVLDGKVVVLERGQLTRLHDLDGDGEADFYENVCNDWHTGAGEHAYDSCLEVDAQGRFYFFKTGDTHLPTGGCLLRVSPDGKTVETFATGFRHPVGMGLSPKGMLTGADQEGNWMPSTRLDAYKQGGFYGDMRAHHRPSPPATYDPPLCWLPREMDNSAGGQVWAPATGFGPLSGQMIHLSYGRCAAMLVLPQEVGDVVQGGAIDLGWTFLSGSMRGRFGPDGALYVAGMDGWQTAAKKDGSLQRVRYTGKPAVMPTALAVVEGGIRLTFSEPVDAKSADARLFQAQQWNYRWSGDYGSKRWSVANPGKEGPDAVKIDKATLSADGKTVELAIPGLSPVMQFQLRYDVAAATGPSRGALYLTIHKPAPR